MRYVLTIAALAALATPALADEVGVGVGPVGVTVGSHRDYDRDRDRTTVITFRVGAGSRCSGASQCMCAP